MHSFFHLFRSRSQSNLHLDDKMFSMNISGNLMLGICYHLKILKMTTKPEQKNSLITDQTQKRTLKSLVNTPFKKFLFGIQILSYVLILASPAIGAIIGNILDLKTGQTAGVILGIFIMGEILFYGSLAFLGKELILLLKDRVKKWFGRRSS